MNVRFTDALSILTTLDLTSLGENDSTANIRALCEKAKTPFGSPAAICVYPEHINGVLNCLNELRLSNTKIATVVNFPDGSTNAGRAERETKRAIAVGATEIDLVFPYSAYLAGEQSATLAVLKSCRKACENDTVLKVILESGAFSDTSMLADACHLVLSEGANFLKTSTGKTSENASLEAARVMLEVIHRHGNNSGFKASGGIRTLNDALPYRHLAEEICGACWATPEHFRIGASSLLDDLLDVLKKQQPK